MLQWQNGATFAVGQSSYYDQAHDQPSETARIHVPVELDGVSVLALLDTGAAWSMVTAELAEELGLFDRDGEQTTIVSRLGTMQGRLVRAMTTLVAEHGDSLEVEATVFVSHDWTAGNFLGYSGLLERIRFAVDPYTNSFFFGSSENHLPA